MFVRLFQWYFSAYAVACSAPFLFEGATAGNWTLAPLWAAIFLFHGFLIWFRKRYFLVLYSSTAFMGFAVHPALACVHYDSMEARFATYGECVGSAYNALSIMLWVVGARTPNPTPRTPNPKPQTPNPKPRPQAPNPKLQTPNPPPTGGRRRAADDRVQVRKRCGGVSHRSRVQRAAQV